jgi:CDP-diacylglycerol--glycerol-3-phosphate 3-phosphatidyltransferase
MKTAKHKQAWYIINGITMYRIIAAPFLLILLFNGQVGIFKWLLGVSFFTDLIDGFLARKFNVASVLGTRLDSVGDDLTVLVAMIGLFVLKADFIKEQKLILILLLVLFIVQAGYAFKRYGKMTGFHTWLAKAAALLQGVFLLLAFFTDQPSMILFYSAAIITMLQLIEEIILVHLLPQWQTNVKGLYWVLKNTNSITSNGSF